MESIQNFLQIIKGMQWSDYLDILVVAFLIYKLLPLLRTPNVMRIARTVIALVVVAWLTSVMRLHTLSWILNQFLAVGLLTFVILFQPELRRMLDHLGNVKLSRFFAVSRPMAEMDAVIAQTVMACEIMSREKVGALIVFAREQRLDEYIKTGTVIDGQVSEQLLRNIFFKNSPLHDGALIIQDGRVVAAGCVLPLSDSSRLGSEVGTRHRAGVGISEVSDAVVVIVSEENGVISESDGGMLKRHLAPQTLERLLHNELCPADPAEKTARDPKAVLQSIKNRRKEAGGHEKK